MRSARAFVRVCAALEAVSPSQGPSQFSHARESRAVGYGSSGTMQELQALLKRIAFFLSDHCLRFRDEDLSGSLAVHRA